VSNFVRTTYRGFDRMLT